jgi:hypothetical protein
VYLLCTADVHKHPVPHLANSIAYLSLSDLNPKKRKKKSGRKGVGFCEEGNDELLPPPKPKRTQKKRQRKQVREDDINLPPALEDGTVSPEPSSPAPASSGKNSTSSSGSSSDSSGIRGGIGSSGFDSDSAKEDLDDVFPAEPPAGPGTPLAGPGTPLAGPGTPLAGPGTPPAGPGPPPAGPGPPPAAADHVFHGRDPGAGHEWGPNRITAKENGYQLWCRHPAHNITGFPKCIKTRSDKASGSSETTLLELKYWAWSGAHCKNKSKHMKKWDHIESISAANELPSMEVLDGLKDYEFEELTSDSNVDSDNNDDDDDDAAVAERLDQVLDNAEVDIEPSSEVDMAPM